MATNTYVAIESQTITSTVASITLGSGETIPQTYTDLILVVSGKSSGIYNWGIRFNGDTGSRYSRTLLYGSGSATGSTRQSNSTSANPGFLTANGSPTLIQIMDYSNTTTNKSWLARAGDASDSVSISVGMWRPSNLATGNITSITLFSDGGTYIESGTTVTLYGIANSRIGAPKAFGGTITQDSTYTYHIFGASGTFTPTQSLTVDYLVVAGGGGGGSTSGAGGGAGGLRSTVGATGGGGSLESALSVTAQNYSITIGAGGAGGSGGSSTGVTGTVGSNSVFSTITSAGGGGGGGNRTAATSGGSGGGGGSEILSTGGAGTTNQGFAGGTSGGGGGAGGVGANSNGAIGGAGVEIKALAIPTGTGVVNSYAGGGGSGSRSIDNVLNGGLATAGGGRGSNGYQLSGSAGTANTGGGGGGGDYGTSSQYTAGGAGGSGIVIIRYAN